VLLKYVKLYIQFVLFLLENNSVPRKIQKSNTQNCVVFVNDMSLIIVFHLRTCKPFIENTSMNLRNMITNLVNNVVRVSVNVK